MRQPQNSSTSHLAAKFGLLNSDRRKETIYHLTDKRVRKRPGLNSVATSEI